MNNAFETFIKTCGSVTKAAKAIDADREQLSAMRRGVVNVSLIHALEIQKYMHEKHNISLQVVDLVPLGMKHRLKKLSLPCTEQRIKLNNIPLNNVNYSPSNVHCPKNDITNFDRLRPIILDENKQLIANKNTYLLYKLQDKKTIPAWHISLSDLLAKTYLPITLIQIFRISERSAIGISTKKYLGNLQGERSDLRLRRNFDEVIGRTDEQLGFLLGLGSKDNYRLAEKIQLYGGEELIHFVDEEKITLSLAARLIHLPHKKQKKLLKLSKKEIRNFIYRNKGRLKK